MVVNGFRRLSESYQSRDKLNNSIKEMVETLEKDFRVLDKYPVKINHDGVTISRKNKLDIISTECWLGISILLKKKERIKNVRTRIL